MTALPVVIHRDAHLLVLLKPAGLPTTSPTGKDCLVELAHLIDPDAPRLHPTSRLDAEVTGLVTFARTEHATRALLQARERGDYARRYVAIVSPSPVSPSGSWSSAIAIDPQNPRRRVAKDTDASRGGRSSNQRDAHSQYRTLAHTALPVQGGQSQGFALLCLSPLTGRTHQLRVHASHAACPIFGDRHYGGATRFTADNGRVWSARRVMLHCAALRIPSPTDGAPLTLVASVPDDMSTLWIGLGGAAHDFGDADSLLRC